MLQTRLALRNTIWLVAIATFAAACSDDDGSGSNDGSGGERSGSGGEGTGSGGRTSSGGSAEGGGDGDNEGDGDGDGAGKCRIFPADNAWNLDISRYPVHENSDNYVKSVGLDDTMHPDFGTVWDGAPIGIPYLVVDASTPLTQIVYSAYGDESDPGPFPIPLDAPIEGGPDSDGDRHVIAVDHESCLLYELYSAYPVGETWEAASGAVYDLSENDDHPEGCTSADAAGLPIFPGLVRYDEVVEQGEINHALRFTVQKSQRAYVYPARHYASNDTNADLPAMGMRFRMKNSFDCGDFSNEAQVICAALKKYGMIVADNGSNWYLSGAPDSRWDDEALGDIKTIPGRAFEVVETGDPLVTDAPDCSIE